MNAEPFQPDNVESLLFLKPWMKLDEKLIAGFTTKNGGISKGNYHSLNLGLHVQDAPADVIANREQVADELGIPLSKWICAEQVHENKVAKVTSADVTKGVFDYKDGIPQTDGIYTAKSNILLTLCFADCVPLYFFSPNKKKIGLAHAGWRGTVQNIAGKMIEKWINDEKILVEDIYAAVGPAIGPCCYVVDEKVISLVKKVLKDTKEAFYRPVSEGQYHLNLGQVNVYLLQQAGLREENILTSNLCTSCEKELFFSHRRDKGKTGRMLSFIGYKED